ncbi:hypothetical protein ACFYMX_19375 [Streptomyces griseofuscus]|uniref:hypothetical protein n=1 Tax=Streptomyces griseofuscus TaxID=146922 RepID=UPI0036871C8B
MTGGAGTGDVGCRGEAGRAEPERGEARQDEAGQDEAGRWPGLEAALAVVNRDVRATLPGQEPLILMVTPAPDGAAGSTGSYGGQEVYVAMADGRSHGNPVHAGDLEEGAPPEPGDAATVLSVVAEAAQETVMELLWQVWPLCREHGIGMHPRPASTSEDWCPGEPAAAGPPVWWCRGGRTGGCHDASPIGELADTLRGKERRALRRGRRR